jgi:hypothetical protein
VKWPLPEFHAVYIDPESYTHYEKTGKFRDGTVMIKELVGVAREVKLPRAASFEPRNHFQQGSMP